MKCDVCGTPINENDKYCINCGAAYKSDDYNLIISRPGKIMGCAVDLHINIEDREYDLSSGKSFKLKLENGEHTIKYKVWCRKEHSVIINIEDNKICDVQFVYDALWGGFKVSKKSVL